MIDGLVHNHSRVELGGVLFDVLSEEQVVDAVFHGLSAGVGGQVVTPNVDIVQRLRDPSLRGIIGSASIIVADGTPLVWASRLRGLPIRHRVTGADLLWSLSARAAESGKTVLLIGGRPGVADRAAVRLRQVNPSLSIVGVITPSTQFDVTSVETEVIQQAVLDRAPDLVFVCLGFPKQDLLAMQLRTALPQAWFVGCGAAIDFVAGTSQRAPRWMQRAGLEWSYRLLREPRRLAGRYLRDDFWFAVQLLADAVAHLVRRKWGSLE